MAGRLSLIPFFLRLNFFHPYPSPKAKGGRPCPFPSALPFLLRLKAEGKGGKRRKGGKEKTRREGWEAVGSWSNGMTGFFGSP